ncbi:MAG: family 3 adenylate cyclase [Chloroflexota bacterium]|nr:family 3 adenylate cyclase [Chloroflexota bacterium]
MSGDVDPVETLSGNSLGEPARAPKRDDQASIVRLLNRISLIGVAPDDADDVRVQKVTLTLAAVTVTVLAVFWVGTYLALGLPVSAAIPFAYQVASVVTLVAFARTKDYRFFRFSQIVLIFLLPFLLQWSLGGYVASSAVSLWALVGVFGALFFYTARQAVPWFAVFVVLTIISGLMDPSLAASAAAIPMGVQVTFFVLNILGVSVTAYLLLQYAVRERDAALARSDGLLLNVLPRSIAERLKRDPGVIAERYDEVTVLFADVADFTPFAERTSPERLVGVLNEVFSAFDNLTERHALEKIKTIGDAYMVAGGLPELRADHAEAVAALAVDMQSELARVCSALDLGLAIRIGIDSGPVVAGVIGRRKFIYDLWGDTVNTASRMESHGIAGRIQVTEATYRRLRDRYRFEDRGEMEVKGKGRIKTYLLVADDVDTGRSTD